ncbi:MAG TPA: diphthine--ammonia ligase [Mucilaginibacter sp.]|nr:diphthine--ammonia ligase [Mucilaginibacter sp.]
MEKIKCIFNWSGGKDSALALYHCLQDPKLEIKYLVTTINDKSDRIAMHGVRVELLNKQVENIGIPLYPIRLPEMPDMQTYDSAMQEHLFSLRNEGITHAIFGDIFLEDLKHYRDRQLSKAGMTGIYPLWKRDSQELLNEFWVLGFGTVIACTQARLKHIAGQELTAELVRSFPANVDVCGENGEFHTFTFMGPIFKNRINYKKGELVFKEYKAPDEKSDDQTSSDFKTNGFWFCDLISG